MTRPLAVVVLAGGEGRRMGGDKPLRPYGEGTLLAHAVGLARLWSRDVAIAVRQPGALPEPPAPLICDPPGIAGPAAGLQAALAHGAAMGAAAVLTLPCDAPRLPTDLAERLEAALRVGVVAAVATSGGRLHPTCALWRTDAADRLAAYLAGGGRSLRGFAEACRAAVVEWPLMGASDPFANANTPAELAALQP